MMRTRGLTGPFFGRHVGNRASHPLAHSAGNFISIEDDGPDLGPELVVNGDFSSGIAWTPGANWSIGGGVASCDGLTATDIIQNLAIVDFNTYQVKVTTLNGTYAVNGLGVRMGDTSAQHSILADGSYTFQLVCGVLNNRISFWNSGNGSFVGDIDDVSVKEVL